MSSCKDKWVRKFFITDTNLHKTGFTIYKVTSLIFLKHSPETASSVSVWKRYSDFKTLYKSLHTIYKNSSIKEPFPKFAKSKYFGRFDKKVVDERRECANKFLEFIAKYTVLYTHDIFIKFFEPSIDCLKASGQSVSTESLDEDHDHHDKSIADVATLNQLGISSEFKTDICSQSLTRADENNIIVTSIENSNDGNIKLNATIITFGLNNILEECYGNLRKHDIPLVPNNSQVLNKAPNDFNHYVIIAAAHINAGHKHEHLEEYKEAYVQYKLGIMQLQHCVNVDPDLLRQKKVLEKVSKYLNKLDEIYQKYLKNDIFMFVKPVVELKKYKILKIMGSTTILVKDTEENIQRIVKTVAKPAGCINGVDNYILYPKVSLMVQLHAFIETETTIFFILEYINGQKLWEMIAAHDVGNNIKLNDSVEYENSENLSESLNSTNYKTDEMEVEENTTDFNGHHDLSINQLLDKAKKLLISVDVTLKQGDSMASRLNELEDGSENTIRSSYIRNDSYYIKGSHQNHQSRSLLDRLSIKKVTIPKDLGSYSEHPLTFDDIVDYIDEQHVNIDHEVVNNDYDDINELELEYWSIPEDVIRRWAAQLLQVLEVLHEQNIVLMNLRTDKILIDQDGCIRLNCIIPQQGYEFIDCHIPYTAPELYMYISPISVHPAADVWSFGMIMYELFTGIKFSEDDSYLFYSHSAISIPCKVSENARSLLTSVLKLNPDERPNIWEIKKHPFFETPD